VDEIRPGLWHWTAPHPAWKPDDGGPEGWKQEVSSYAYVASTALVLIDPLEVPPELDDLRAGLSTAVLLTTRWHQRSAAELGAPVFARAAEIEHVTAPATPYEEVATLPGSIEVKGTPYPEEVVLWMPEHRALAVGDVVLGRPEGPRLPSESWLGDDMSPEALREGLRPLLELPIDLLLLTHGGPVADGRAALAAALET
jgi:glyoxylase-like metal-dependent hydrolase (beta-lactamase superfamily II)